MCKKMKIFVYFVMFLVTCNTSHVSVHDRIAYSLHTGMLTALGKNSTNMVLTDGHHDTLMVCGLDLAIEGCKIFAEKRQRSDIHFSKVSLNSVDAQYACFTKLRHKRNLLPLCILHNFQKMNKTKDNNVEVQHWSKHNQNHGYNKHHHRNEELITLVRIDMLQNRDTYNIRFWVSTTLFILICVFLTLAF